MPVWIHSGYAASYKADNGREAFKQWVRPFTAHDEKLGLNAKGIEKRFTFRDEADRTIHVPAGRKAYDNFAKMAQKLDQITPAMSFEEDLDIGTLQAQRPRQLPIAPAPTDLVFAGDPYSSQFHQAFLEVDQLRRDYEQLVQDKKQAEDDVHRIEKNVGLDA
jgi:hypothetical protein